MRIACVSDLHGHFGALRVPACDVLVIAGDIVGPGHNSSLDAFVSWARSQPCRRVLFVPGNHDSDLLDARMQRSLPGVVNLYHAGCAIDDDSDAKHAGKRRLPQHPPRIKSQKINVSEFIRTLVDSTLATVMVSATLTTNERGGFGYLHQETGYKMSETDTLIVPTPFDYHEQAAQVVLDLPSPAARNYLDEAGHAVREIILATGGRTLVLCTSYEQVRAIHASVNGKVPYRVLCQSAGDAERGGNTVQLSRRQLVAEFKRDETSCLIGTTSFWTGIDVPGAACSAVVVMRVPFEPPGSPLLQALGEDSFSRRSTPQAILRLRQGIGRLLRTRTDRGIVAVLDSRIRDPRKGYGKFFTVWLPRKIIALADVPAHLAGTLVS